MAHSRSLRWINPQNQAQTMRLKAIDLASLSRTKPHCSVAVAELSFNKSLQDMYRPGLADVSVRPIPAEIAEESCTHTKSATDFGSCFAIYMMHAPKVHITNTSPTIYIYIYTQLNPPVGR